MFTFKEFIKEQAQRTPETAIKMVNYIDKRRKNTKNIITRMLGGNLYKSKNNFTTILPYADQTKITDKALKKYGGNLWDTFHTHGEIRHVPFHSLYTNQGDVGKNELISKLRGTFRKEYHPEEPIIPYVLHDTETGEHHLIDGNHRGVKERLLGNKYLVSKVLDV